MRFSGVRSSCATSLLKLRSRENDASIPPSTRFSVSAWRSTGSPVARVARRAVRWCASTPSSSAVPSRSGAKARRVAKYATPNAAMLDSSTTRASRPPDLGRLAREALERHRQLEAHAAAQLDRIHEEGVAVEDPEGAEPAAGRVLAAPRNRALGLGPVALRGAQDAARRPTAAPRASRPAGPRGPRRAAAAPKCPPRRARARAPASAAGNGPPARATPRRRRRRARKPGAPARTRARSRSRGRRACPCAGGTDGGVQLAA